MSVSLLPRQPRRKSADIKDDKIRMFGGDEFDYLVPRVRKFHSSPAGFARRIKRGYNARRRRMAKNAIQDLPLEELEPVTPFSDEERAIEERIAYKQHMGEPLDFMEWLYLTTHDQPDARQAADLEEWELRHTYGLS